MKNLLNKIIEQKHLEVALGRKERPIEQLVKLPLFNVESKSFSKAVKEGSGVVAEFKRKSPSAGAIGGANKLEEIIALYKSNKVSACSILTDFNYFGGSIKDLEEAKRLIDVPLLRKDFIVDEYQLFEAKAYGADVVLLIAEALDEYHAKHLVTIANSIGLEVLMEFHSADELNKLNENVDVVGINNRNLKTLEVDLNKSISLMKQLPYNVVKIAESGIKSVAEIKQLLAVGYDGFLIGESILKDEKKIAEFVHESLEVKQSKMVAKTKI